MKKGISAIAFIFLLFTACNNTQPEPTPDTPAPPTEETVKNHSDWNSFWADFQKAVKDDNESAAKSMTKIGDMISEKDWNENYSFYFPEMKDHILATGPEGVEPEDGGEQFKELRTLWKSESGEDDEGNVYESALGLYFDKVDGNWKLVMFFAAG